eukprot:COSAG05_NODE_2054_length_3633_cov_4.249010_2_plen_212_part_00
MIGGPKTQVMHQAALASEANLPFWLQMIGSGLTTVWAAHLGAVLTHATWPAITCLNLFTTSLLTPATDIKLVDGYHRVPSGPGLGVEVNEALVSALAMSKEEAASFTSFAAERVMYTAFSPLSGSRLHFAQTEPKAKGIAAGKGDTCHVASGTQLVIHIFLQRFRRLRVLTSVRTRRSANLVRAGTRPSLHCWNPDGRVERRWLTAVAASL